MRKYVLNYASYTDGELYAECLGVFDSKEKALAKRAESISQDEVEYSEAEHGNDYDSFIRQNNDIEYKWDNDALAQTYRIQVIGI